ncbi:hypothetical protein FACUT_13017 [Fusarium acutatum]|uniref:Uncharacterized protein n=1 Tax=Fusarium acutatum TaxID=78861 RepID=A0A8H4JA05_9HYPO|nr:hypothetical protein FACUT_13017 [Fusarium acutatum]
MVPPRLNLCDLILREATDKGNRFNRSLFAFPRLLTSSPVRKPEGSEFPSLAIQTEASGAGTLPIIQPHFARFPTSGVLFGLIVVLTVALLESGRFPIGGKRTKSDPAGAGEIISLSFLEFGGAEDQTLESILLRTTNAENDLIDSTLSKIVAGEASLPPIRQGRSDTVLNMERHTKIKAFWAHKSSICLKLHNNVTSLLEEDGLKFLRDWLPLQLMAYITPRTNLNQREIFYVLIIMAIKVTSEARNKVAQFSELLEWVKEPANQTVDAIANEEEPKSLIYFYLHKHAIESSKDDRLE